MVLEWPCIGQLSVLRLYLRLPRLRIQLVKGYLKGLSVVIHDTKWQGLSDRDSHSGMIGSVSASSSHEDEVSILDKKASNSVVVAGTDCLHTLPPGGTSLSHV